LVQNHQPYPNEFLPTSSSQDLDLVRPPFVQFEVSGLNEHSDQHWDDEALEYSWQIDNKGWHMYENGPLLTLDDPALMLFGWHTVEIRARLKNQSKTLDPYPFKTQVLIDPLAPSLTLTPRVSDQSWIQRFDLVLDDVVSPKSRLKTQLRWVSEHPSLSTSSDWIEINSQKDTLDLQKDLFDQLNLTLDHELIQSGHVEVRVTDEANHTTTVIPSLAQSTFPLIGRGDPALASTDSGGCACHIRPSDSHSSGKGFSFLLLFLFLSTRLFLKNTILVKLKVIRIKRLLWMSLFLIVLVTSFGGCDDDVRAKPEGGQDICTQCGPNQLCEAGVCVALECTDLPEQCALLECEEGASGECSPDGICQCSDAPLCPEGCGSNTYCCYQTNQCEPIPPACEMADEMEGACPPGYEWAAVN
jgi:hypothetical protein